MGQKVHPFGFRLGGIYTWSSRWYARNGDYRSALKQDLQLRKFLRGRLKESSVAKVDIERSSNTLTLNIFTAKPGVIIGRGGQGVETLRKELKAQLDPKMVLTLNILEVDKPNLSAALTVQSIAADLEKRIPFRRCIKQALGRLMKAGAEGGKIMVSGRLDGAEIARVEKVAQGKVPLHTLRANLEYSRGVAHTTFGTVGIKVWVYRGEVLERGKTVEQAVVTQQRRRPSTPMNA